MDFFFYFRNLNNSSTEWELEKVSKFLLNKNKVIPYRRDAIREILNESNVGDLILIAGRGNEEVYINDDKLEFFTDMDIVNGMTKIQEVEVI